MAAKYGPTCETPVEFAAMRHWWDALTFIHWRYEPGAIQRALPTGLTVESFDGSAWIGLVPFYLRVGFPYVPSIRWFSRFAETNIRTYVRDADGRSGIWFFSLDAARLGAVVVARATYRLPYFWSRMRVEHSGSTITYRSARRWPGPRGARTDAVIEIGEPYATDELTELDHFLTARWALYSCPRSGLHRAQAYHAPWPLHRARVISLHDELVAGDGLPAPVGEPIAHYSPSVDVRIGWPRKVR
ncbi:MAG TPA: DUF2071 domain-containing protein [Acidimicrobiia bacterium]|nr:DUF2071 domain-containing protein [Acidimicrobiia bacterium]